MDLLSIQPADHLGEILAFLSTRLLALVAGTCTSLNRAAMRVVNGPMGSERRSNDFLSHAYRTGGYFTLAARERWIHKRCSFLFVPLEQGGLELFRRLVPVLADGVAMNARRAETWLSRRLGQHLRDLTLSNTQGECKNLRGVNGIALFEQLRVLCVQRATLDPTAVQNLAITTATLRALHFERCTINVEVQSFVEMIRSAPSLRLLSVLGSNFARAPSAVIPRDGLPDASRVLNLDRLDARVPMYRRVAIRPTPMMQLLEVNDMSVRHLVAVVATPMRVVVQSDRLTEWIHNAWAYRWMRNDARYRVSVVQLDTHDVIADWSTLPESTPLATLIPRRVPEQWNYAMPYAAAGEARQFDQ